MTPLKEQEEANSTVDTMVRKRAVKRPAAAENKVPAKKGRKSRTSFFVPPTLEKPSGMVFACGQGDVGQLGLGDADGMNERKRATRITGLDDVVQVCAGGMHSVCLTKNGEVYTFGCNDDGALGRDTSEEGSEFTPGLVQMDGKVIQISAGDSHTAALLEDGRVFAWGSFRDSSGSMGLTANGTEKTPIQLLPAVTFSQIASGSDHLLMLTTQGLLYSCGCGEQGQLGRVAKRGANRKGRSGTTQLLTPCLVWCKSLRFSDVWSGSYCTFAKERVTGKIYVCGLNNYHQMGLGDTERNQFFLVLSEVFSGKIWKSICGGQHHTVALDSEGHSYVLGRKEYGRLGLGENRATDAEELTLVPQLQDKECVNVAAGETVSFAVTKDGTAYAWGMGTNLQLGNGSEDDAWEPLQVTGQQLQSKKVIQVSAGGQHTLFLVQDEAP